MNHSIGIGTLGWRTLWRDARAGELRLLWVAVTLAVAALTAVGFFTDRLQGGLQRDARQLLGGDAVVASDNPPPAPLAAEARRRGLSSVLTLTFPTMGRASEAKGGAARLVALKAVPSGYPLRGQLQTAAAPGHAGQATREVPGPGEVWVDPALLEGLELTVGDELLLGDAALRIARVIVDEPDRGSGFMNFAPRAMMAEADLARTHLIQPASRVSYRLALAGEDAAVKSFVAWAEARVLAQGWRGLRVESLESGRPEMRQTLDRAEKFLRLVALLAALLSAVAVALAARDFANRHLDDCAMLRVLGLSQSRMAGGYLVEFALVGLSASAVGVALGYAVHFAFAWLLRGLVAAELPPPSLWPVGLGVGVGLTLLATFGVPPVLQLAQVPPLRVIRRDVGGLQAASLAVLSVGALGFAALLVTVSSERMLGLIAVGGFAAAAGVFAALSWLAVRALRWAVRDESAPRWLVLATRQIAARPGFAVMQISALSVGLLALVLLVLMRTDLVQNWRSASPPDAPNRFVINVLPEQAEGFQQTLRDAGVTRFDWYPMFRGRLVAVNGRPIGPQDFPDERAQRTIDREFNLSHAGHRPAHNDIVAGRWTPEEADAISVEEGLAQTLHLHLGDRLRFDIGGMSSEARITSLRKVDWASMRVNFYAMYPVSQMSDLPITYISAFRSPEQPGFDNRLVKAYPNITSVDMASTIAQIQRVLNQVIGAVEFLFAFTLAAGLLVLFAAVSATREERSREYAILRALGASSVLLRQVQRVELIGVGTLAGVLASSVATAIGWALARYVFDFEWHISWSVIVGGALAGAVLALLAGWWGLREVLRRPVMATLREAQ